MNPNLAAVRMTAQHAVAEAFRVRAANGIIPRQPIRVVDLALKLNIEVRFNALPSMEGMFLASPPTIFLSSFRPAGRKNFSCAHELAHWKFGDVIAIDEFEEHRTRPVVRGSNEWAAQVFAGSLLMPRPAVEDAFLSRGWMPKSCSEAQAFTVASAFGVGYTTMLDHMAFSLRIIPTDHAERLKKVPLPAIKASLLGFQTPANLVVVDLNWREVPIDLEVGDLLLVTGAPDSMASPDPGLVRLVPHVVQHCRLFEAQTPGTMDVTLSNGVNTVIRVSRKGFTGRAIWRHEPEVNDET